MRSFELFAVVLTCAAACSIYGAEEEDETPPRDRGDAGPDASNVDGNAPDGQATVDAGDAGPTGCDRTKPFSEPVMVPGLTTDNYEAAARLTPDELQVFWARYDGAQWALWTSARLATNDPFGLALKLSGVNDPDAGRDFDPAPTPDGLALYLTSERLGGGDIFVSTRMSKTGGFGAATKVDQASSSGDDRRPYVAPDGKSLWFDSTRAGPTRIYRMDTSTLGVSNPVQIDLGAPNDGVHDESPVISNDGLALYFGGRNRNGVGTHVFMATRNSVNASFGTPVQVVAYTSAIPSWISPDECRLYVSIDGKGEGLRLYMVERAK